jgi:hypothetical protein
MIDSGHNFSLLRGPYAGATVKEDWLRNCAAWQAKELSDLRLQPLGMTLQSTSGQCNAGGASQVALAMLALHDLSYLCIRIVFDPALEIEHHRGAGLRIVRWPFWYSCSSRSSGAGK